MSLTVQYNQLDYVRNEIHQGLRIDGAGSSSWVSWDALRSLNDITTYLEIGTREGSSLYNMVLSNSDSLKEIHIVDTWESEYGGSGRGSHDHIAELLTEMNYSGAVVFHDGSSHDILPSLELENHFDAIYVDGDHSYEGGLNDLNNVLPLVKPGGVILFDDIAHPSHLDLEDAFDKFVESNENVLENSEKNKSGLGCGIVWKKT